jgi:hypothetical protein
MSGALRADPAVSCDMRFGMWVAVAASGLTTLAGLKLALSNAGTDIAAFGWLLFIIGALFVVVNLVLGARMR